MTDGIVTWFSDDIVDITGTVTSVLEINDRF